MNSEELEQSLKAEFENYLKGVLAGMREDGEPIPASHMNFLIANGAVIVPQYGTPSGELAVAALKDLFPDREVIGLLFDELLSPSYHEGVIIDGFYADAAVALAVMALDGTTQMLTPSWRRV